MIEDNLDENQPGTDRQDDLLHDEDVRSSIAEVHEGKYQPGDFTPPKKSKKTLRKLVIAIIILIILAGGGFAVWKFILNKDKNNTSKPNNAQQSQPVVSTGGSSESGDTNLSETYKSDEPRLEFNYPKSWNVSEKDGAIIIKSPNSSFQTNSGEETSGFFKIYIKQGAGASDRKYLGKGYAISPSQKIKYTEPEVGQRKETYLTGFGLDTPDNFAYFIVQGNFNLKKGDTLGPDFAHEPDAFLIAGGFSSDDQKDPLQTQVLDASSYSSIGLYKTAVEIVKSLKLK